MFCDLCTNVLPNVCNGYLNYGENQRQRVAEGVGKKTSKQFTLDKG